MITFTAIAIPQKALSVLYPRLTPNIYTIISHQPKTKSINPDNSDLKTDLYPRCNKVS